jgi:hypothetical protein
MITPLDGSGAKSTGLEQQAIDFYRDAMVTLQRAGIRFLVGGAYALRAYTGIERHTKDFDIFILPADVHPALDALGAAGYKTKIQADYWLAKAFFGDDFVDLIYSSGNGVARVDEVWFEHARDAEVFGLSVKVIPPEEMIWSKSFIMERERYDGADVAHVLLKCAADFDWRRLLGRFGSNWRVLFSYLVLFGFIYPGQRDRVPAWVMERLLGRLQEEMASPPPDVRVCDGTMISRQQYLVDVTRWGFADGRLVHGYMSADEIEEYTAGIREDGDPPDPRALDTLERTLHEKLHEQEERPV